MYKAKLIDKEGIDSTIEIDEPVVDRLLVPVTDKKGKTKDSVYLLEGKERVLVDKDKLIYDDIYTYKERAKK